MTPDPHATPPAYLRTRRAGLYAPPSGLALPERSLGTLDYVHHCDALTLLNALPSGSVDLVVTSPPYNLRTAINGAKLAGRNAGWSSSQIVYEGYDGFGDDMPHEDYVKWQRQILTGCMRVLKPTGAIFYNHKWRIQGGLLDMRAGIVEGLPVRQIIIWHRGSSVNHNKRFFSTQYEVIYVIAKPEFSILQSATGFGDVWTIMPEVNNDHPAPFPVQLAERCIMSTSAQLILDPFMGSGTTAVAAKKLGRHFIGCDVSAKYVHMANERLAMPTPLPMFPELMTA